MKRIGFALASALAATGLAAIPASATAAAPRFCIPESVTLTGAGGASRCLMAPTPSITPPFTAFSEQNGSQRPWCLYTAPDYGGVVVTIPPFSGAKVAATFASGRPC